MATSNSDPDLPNTDNSPGLSQQPYYMNGKIIISALVILLLIVLFIMALHIYAKCFGRRGHNNISRRQVAVSAGVWHLSTENSNSLQLQGLDKAVIDTMPVFVYKALPFQSSSLASTAVECAVCLSEFQNDEKCRFLPNCSHGFHTECIDKWFLTNTTCPICRTPAEPLTGEHGHGALIMPGFDQRERRMTPDEATFEQREGLDCAGAHPSCEEISSACLLNPREMNDNARNRSWRRSISDRFTGVSDSVQFPTNVLFWGNHSHMSSRIHSDHWQIGGRSLPHIVVDIGRQQEGLLSGSPSHCSPIQHPLSPSTTCGAQAQRPFQRFKSLRRLLSREKKVPPAENENDSCGCSQSAFTNA